MKKHPSNQDLPDDLVRLSLEANLYLPIMRLYLLGQVIANERSINQLTMLTQQHDLDHIVQLNDIDVTKDLIKVYAIHDGDSQFHLMAIIDPVELYMNPYMISLSRNVEIPNQYLTNAIEQFPNN